MQTINDSAVLLTYNPPWNWQQFHAHFALRKLTGVEHLSDNSYTRSFQLGAHCGWFKIEPLTQQNALKLSFSPSALGCTDELTLRVRRMFDLDADPLAIARHFSSDPHVAQLVERMPGLRLPIAFDPFEQAVRTIVGQQVTVKAAVTVTGRLVSRLGEPLSGSNPQGIERLFPSPRAIAEANLEGIGMPGKRVQTLQYFAGQIASGELNLSMQQGYLALVEKLCALPGIGPWTAEYIALRAFGEPDAFPASDLGLLKAPIWGEQGISARQLQAHAQAWRPWRAYAAAYLWQNYSEL
ncbi:DNA-3-methyladenine glycosylase family protein [Pseudomonas segetis]|uniref:DNA-3-methyladenine glycosylase II n=1 Tax=Pseudomonas segetis TaxID=298908 RepID=A0A239AAA0_9PSED|nr:DNA-3-methyladenine glycosylase [Pseudomonas segetis]SNR92332.1 DNA-3-methyladenine glycosylase II [Pseudomonas segetis]